MRKARQVAPFVRESLTFGFKNSPKLLLGILGVLTLSAITLGLLVATQLWLLILVGSILIFTLQKESINFIALKIVDKKQIKFKDMYAAISNKGVRICIVKFLTGIIVGLGFFLLVIPGVYWFACLSLAPYLIISENLGIIAAMKKSVLLTRGARLQIMTQFAGIFLFFTVGSAIFSGLSHVAGSAPTTNIELLAILGIIGMVTLSAMLWAGFTAILSLPWIYRRLQQKT